MYKQITNEDIIGKKKRNEEIKYGLFLARLQPVHNAHLYVIDKALSECDALLILVGSGNKFGSLRNPFTAEKRLEWLASALSEREDYSRIAIDSIPDWAGETRTETFSQWGHYLYYNAVSRMGQKKFTMYYCDEPEKVLCWFDGEVKDNISFRFMERESVLEGMSSTRVRKALERMEDEDIEYLEFALPKGVFQKREELSDLWRRVLSDPREDFSMK